MNHIKTILAMLSAIIALIGVTFGIYWFNLDMKLVRKIYDKLQPHYDSLEKDRKL